MCQWPGCRRMVNAEWHTWYNILYNRTKWMMIKIMISKWILFSLFCMQCTWVVSSTDFNVTTPSSVCIFNFFLMCNIYFVAHLFAMQISNIKTFRCTYHILLMCSCVRSYKCVSRLIHIFLFLWTKKKFLNKKK